MIGELDRGSLVPPGGLWQSLLGVGAKISDPVTAATKTSLEAQRGNAAAHGRRWSVLAWWQLLKGLSEKMPLPAWLGADTRRAQTRDRHPAAAGEAQRDGKRCH